MKLIPSKQTLTEVGGLTAGNLAGRFAKNKFLGSQGDMIKNLAPVAVGLLISGKGGMIGSLGKGMAAGSLADFLGSMIDKDGSLGLSGVTMLNGYLPGTDIVQAGPDSPMMGNTESNMDSFDYTSSAAGEMDY